MRVVVNRLSPVGYSLKQKVKEEISVSRLGDCSEVIVVINAFTLGTISHRNNANTLKAAEIFITETKKC
ncbi:MAG: hypothetical protein HC836_10690 [Richelia sp. RM2_1_2]|nr:hypothetical protein [Richelia sp. RM2_1_2]